MMGKKLLTRLMLVALTLTGGMASQAALLGASGELLTWGFTPFNNTSSFGNWANGAPPLASGAGAINSGATTTVSWTEANNASPLTYPNSPIENIPSPGHVNSGEAFDQEFLGWRLINGGTQVQILGITSINPNAGAVYQGRTFHVGDIFLDVDGNSSTGVVGGYDYALSSGNYTSNLNDPFHPADDAAGSWGHNLGNGLYALDSIADVHGITNEGGFGGYPAIAAAHNPWAIREGAELVSNSVGFLSESFDYGFVHGANENGTWILEWTFDVALLGPNFDPYRMTLHWATECGNDYIVAGPLLNEPVIPEPATLAMVGLGLASAGLLRRRQRRA